MAVAFVNTASNTGDSSAATIATGASAVSAGNLLCVYVAWSSASATVSSVADSVGNTYQRVTASSAANSTDRSEVWYASNTTAGASNTITATFSASVQYRRIIANQYSGLSTTAPLAAGAVGTAGSGTTVTSGSMTTTVADAVIVAGVVSSQAQTYTAGASFTLRGSTVGTDSRSEDRIVTSTGSYTAGITGSQSGRLTLSAAAFQATSAPPPPPASTILVDTLHRTRASTRLRRVGTMDATGGVVAATPPAPIGGGGVDGEVTTWAQIAALAASSSSEGKTYHVRAGSYTASTLTSLNRASPVKFLGYPGEENSILIGGTFSLVGCTNLVFEGMRFTNGVSVRDVNLCTLDRFKTAPSVNVYDHCQNLLVDRFDISGSPGGASSIGLYGSQGNGTVPGGLVASNCTFRRGKIHPTQTGSVQDGIRIHHGTTLLFDTVEITGVVEGSETHSDAVQIYAAGGSVNGVTFQKVYIHDIDGQGLYSDDITVSNIVVDNCLHVDTGSTQPGTQNQYMLVQGLTVKNSTGWSGEVNWAPRMTKYGSGNNSNIKWFNNVFRNVYFDDGGAVDAATAQRDHNLLSTDTWSTTASAARYELMIAPGAAGFVNTATDDYRLSSSITVNGQTFTPGITWRPADQTYGPGF